MLRAELEGLGLTDAHLVEEGEKLLQGVTIRADILAQGDTGDAQVYREALYHRVTIAWRQEEA